MMGRLAAAVMMLLPAGASAYWAPNHEQMNWNVFCRGRPWDEAGFKRSGKDVTEMFAYARSVLYLTEPGECGAAPAMKSEPKEGSKPPPGTPLEIGRFLYGVKYNGPDQFVFPGLELPTDEPNQQLTLLDWNKRGGLWEDGFNDMKQAKLWGGRRAVNHFHDPLTGSGGYTGVTDVDADAVVPVLNLARRGISVTEWVMNGQSGGPGGKNDWGYPAIGESLFRAFTELKNEKREAGIANAFRALGQVEHLVEDNTVPDHARDLPHPGKGWEEYLAEGPAERFHTILPPWNLFPLKLVERGGLRALWDRDVYTGTNPEVTYASGFDPPGLNEFVNANFYAWNRFTEGPASTDFTTIPDEPGQGFKRTWRFQLAPQGPHGSWAGLRTNAADYPFPKWRDTGANVVGSEVGSLPLTLATRASSSSKEMFESPAVWQEWEEPLLKHALGYAQAVVTLALPPARMEVVASPDGDPLKFSVRLWNLWPAGSPNAVTWHVDELKLVTARPHKDTPIPFADEAPLVIPAGFDVPPGQMRESDLVTITWAQRGAYRYASHAALLMTAHLGTGSTTTKLLFPVVAPNALVWVKQTSGTDLTPPFNNPTQDCDPDACNYASENGVYRNPGHQRVAGQIELAAAEVDSVGREADDELKAIQKADARVAAVALVGLSRERTLEVLHPGQSTLVLTGSQLVPGSAPGVFVRPPNARDEADGPITFEADIYLNDFYRADLNIPLSDAARTSGTIYLAVWTTAGSVQLQRLVLWPWLYPGTAQESVGMDSCAVNDVPHPALVNESRGICSHSAGMTTPSCSMFTSLTRRVQLMWADPGYAQQRAVDSDFTNFLMATEQSSEVRPTSFAGRTVPLSGDAQLPLSCDPGQLSMVWPNGNGEVMCAGFAPTGLALFHAENTPSMSQCSGSPQPPALPRTAEYKRIFRPDAKMWMKEHFGITPPDEWTFTLQ